MDVQYGPFARWLLIVWSKDFSNTVDCMRATPASAKTTLQHLVHQRLLELHPDWDYVSVRGWLQNMDQVRSQLYLQYFSGYNRNELFSVNNLVIFVDDAQSSYYDMQFWTTLKEFHQMEGPYVLLLASHGRATQRPVDMPSGTPPVFRDGQRISLRWFGGQPSSDEPVGILMMMDEVQDMIARLCRHYTACMDFSPDLVKLIYNITDGHAGAVEAVTMAFLESYVSIVNSLSFIKSN